MKRSRVLLMLKNFDFGAVWVCDECHFLAVDEFLAPVAGPEVRFNIEPFKHLACDDVIDADAGAPDLQVP